MWLAVMKFLALQSLVLGAKIRHQVPAYLQVKLKAESFVSSDTKVGELGGAKLFDASGNCISCSSPMLYSLEATPNKKGTVNEEAVPGENISFPVNSSSVYDVLMDLPMSKVTDDLNFSIQVLSAVSATGKNTEEQKGRQVSKWSVQMVLHSTTQKAVVHTGVKVSGDFSKAIDGVSAAGREEAQGPVTHRLR